MDPMYDLPYRPDQARINAAGRAYCEEILSHRPTVAEVEQDDTPLGKARRRAAADKLAGRREWLAEHSRGAA